MSRRKDYSVGAQAESQDGQRRRIDEWMTLVGQHKTTLGFDDWLQQVLDEQHQRAASAAGHGACQPTSRLLRQGDMLFRLEHGARYRVRHAQESARVFTCVFDGETPYIAFENVVTGVRFPWITVDGVFRQTELRSMERLDAGDAGKGTEIGGASPSEQTSPA
jgi:hypothetical protein